MRRKAVWAAVVGILLGLAVISLRNLQPSTYRWEDMLAVYQEQGDYNDIMIEYPLDQTLFPPEMVPPTFYWKDSVSASNVWLVRIEFGDGKLPLCYPSRRRQWTPPTQDWDDIKHRSVDQDARVVVLGVDSTKSVRILSRAKMSFRTSTDPVAAPLFYREVELSFARANKNLADIRWRFGSIASPKLPPVVLTDLPVCGNCHSFSRDGRTLAMDVDYASNKGSYAIAPVQEQMRLRPEDIIT